MNRRKTIKIVNPMDLMNSETKKTKIKLRNIVNNDDKDSL